MIIDFHTHIFPDEVAKIAIPRLADLCKTEPSFDGTLGGIIAHMDDSDVDISVVLSIATKPSQAQSILNFNISLLNNPRIVPFGSVHPRGDDCEFYLEKYAEVGIKGIKLHPDYQQVYVDEPCSISVVKLAQKLGLTVVFHTGLDLGLGDPIHCTVDGMCNLLDKCGDNNIVFAHMGGEAQWERASKAFANSNVYMDLAYCIRRMDDSQMVSYIRQRGCDKYLFATDAPWSSQKLDVEHFLGLPLSEQEKASILGGNAQKLLRMCDTNET